MQHESAIAAQSQHYAAVRSRLMGKPVKEQPARPVVVVMDEESKATISTLRSKLYEAEKQIKLKQELVDKLVLDLSDAHARILAQAEKLSSLDPELSDPDLASPRKPVAKIIAEVLADFPDVTWDDVRGVRRAKHLIVPRHQCMYEVYRQRQDLSLPSIGKIFKRDHSVVLYAVDKIGARREPE